jgi:hypothetical protein
LLSPQGLAGAKVQGHDVYFTTGAVIGTPGCPIPTGAIEWHSVKPLIVLDDWPPVEADELDRFTTIATWREPLGPAEHAGRTYGLKIREFPRFRTTAGF